MPSRILLTGATGFVGQHLYPALCKAGHQVICLSRNAERAKRRFPDREWVSGDVSSAIDIERALSGCDAAYYLVHGLAEGADDLVTREVAAARRFADAARIMGLERIVYLGGPAPHHRASEHLKSRLCVGEALRQGAVPAIELRASMIIGHGSLSWLIVRDLAARLPVMVLPRWLRSKTEPVGIDDVVIALVRALDITLEESAYFDIPGPEALTGREILERTAVVLGLKPPVVLEVPMLSPRLSSKWIHFVTRADWTVANRVVVGLADDLLSESDRYWQLIDHQDRIPFEEAARRAIEAEQRARDIDEGPWGTIEHWVSRTHGQKRTGT